jgi:hypothetical protein
VGFFQTTEGSLDVTFNVQVWPEHGTNTLALGSSFISSGSGEGVGERNYRFFRINIPQTVFTNLQTVYLNVSILSSSSTGSLEVFLRPNYPAGNLGRCYSNLASGVATFSAPYIRELPSCLLSQTDWYVGLFNPAAYPVDPTASVPVLFLIDTRTYGVTSANLGASNWANGTVDPNLPQTWQHFVFTVAASDISFNRNTLRVQAFANVGTVSNLYLNYGSLAGPFTLGTVSCGGSCYQSAAPTLQIDVPSCTLKSGTWYASIQTGGGNTEYAFRAYMVIQNYQDMGAPAQVDPLTFGYPQINSINTDINNRGVDVAYYRFNVPVDRISNTTKMVVNVTNVAGGRVDVTLYKDCKAKTVSTFSSVVLADVADLGPCDLASGEYLLVIAANAAPSQPTWNANFTINVYLRNANLLTLPLTGVAGMDHDSVYNNYHDVWRVDVPQLVNPWSNNTLRVSFNVTCGQITAYLNYGVPGGPGCKLLNCTSGVTNRGNPAQRYNTDCSFFLDTCQVQPGSYYITVVGASQEYSSTFLYQPAKYEIWATAVYYNFTSINPDWWTGYNVTAYPALQATKDWWQYFYLDDETSNPGSRLKFVLNSTVGSSITVAYENAFATQSALTNTKCAAQQSCTIASGQTRCTVLYDSCAVRTGRYFILVKVNTPATDWPWTQVRVWRQEVDIPYLWPGQMVTGTVGDDYPQFYKILVINPTDPEFYGEFEVFNVKYGSVTATLAHVVYTQQTPGQQGNCLSPTFRRSCVATTTANCSINIEPCYPFKNLTFFWQIDATSYSVTNTSVRYSLRYTLKPPVNQLPLFTRICDEVLKDKYDFWRLTPQVSTLEQILYINLTTLYSPETVGLSLSYHQDRLATEDATCFDNYWNGALVDVVGDTGIVELYECAYTDFHLAIRGKTANDAAVPIKYLIEARTQQAPVLNLTLNTPAYYCSGQRYYFKVTVPAGTTFFEVLLDLEDDTKVGTFWVKYGSLAAPNCYDKTANGTAWISAWWIQSCGLPAGVYYITVQSPNSPFVITAKTTNKQAIPVGNATAATGRASLNTPDVDATIPIYTINVTTTQMATINTPQLDFWLTSDTANGPIVISKISYWDGVTPGIAASLCDVPFISTSVGVNTVRYTVKNCYLNAGIYYAFVSATPSDCSVGTYSLGNASVAYSLTAAVTQTIAPVPIALNVQQNNTIQSNQIQHFYINGTRGAGRFLYVRLYDVDIKNPLTVRWSPYRPVDLTATTANSFGTRCVYDGASSSTNDWNARYYAAPALIGSGIFRIDTCLYAPADRIYFMIMPSGLTDPCNLQPYPITYHFAVYDVTWEVLNPNVVSNAVLAENREARFYSITTQTMQSITVRVTPTNADVQVSTMVQDNQCDGVLYVEYRWTKNCVPGQYCDIEIPTRAAHPEKGRLTFYIMVSGNRANYSIIWWAGSQNCEVPQLGAGSFCGDIVNYPSWKWDNWQQLDVQARGIFEQLYLDFHYSRDFSCYVNCNTSLRLYACHQSFRMCDSAGFYTPVCRQVCDNVVYYCENWFETVQDLSMNCTSHQYGDSFYGNCTGLGVKVPYPPNTFVNIQGATGGSSVIAPSLVLLLLALIALAFHL